MDKYEKESLEQNEFTQYPIIPKQEDMSDTGMKLNQKKKHQKKNYYRRNKKQPKPNWNGLLIDETFKYFPCLLD